jgi:hypothetical protein
LSPTETGPAEEPRRRRQSFPEYQDEIIRREFRHFIEAGKINIADVREAFNKPGVRDNFENDPVTMERIRSRVRVLGRNRDKLTPPTPEKAAER